MINRIHLRILLIIAVAAAAFGSDALGQQNRPGAGAAERSAAPALAPNVQEFRLASELMGREVPYRVILPPDYAAAPQAQRYPVVYLLHGLTGRFADWTDKTSLAEYAKAFKFIIVTPEGDNGWYIDSLANPKDKYESYIIRELIPEIDRKFRTRAERGGRVIAGLSMGGYGALKFGLKYPETFSVAGSFSGALGAASWTEKSAGDIGKSLDVIFGPPGSETRRSNDIFALVRERPADKAAALPFIYLDCGTEDFLLPFSRDFANLLGEKKIAHEYRELPGEHDWAFWNQQVIEFLRVAERRMKT